MNDEIEYIDYGSGLDAGSGLFGGLFAALLGVIAFFGIFMLAYYVINAIFGMIVAKKAGHKTPAGMWVPMWNTAILLQLGGIKGAWPWVLILFAAGALTAIPFVGFLIGLASLVLGVMLTVWMARGIQAGLGMRSTGGVILAIFIPFAWIIWMGVRAGKVDFDREAAFAEGDTFPLQWFKNSVRERSFK